MIWAAFLVAALLLAVVAGGDPAARRAALVFAAGIVAMRVWAVGLPEHLLWLAACGTWVAAASSCARQLPVVSFAMLASALCYPWARMIGAPFGQSHPPAIAADLFGVVALCAIGWRCRGSLVGMVGIGRLAADHRRSW